MTSSSIQAFVIEVDLSTKARRRAWQRGQSRIIKRRDNNFRSVKITHANQHAVVTITCSEEAASDFRASIRFMNLSSAFRDQFDARFEELFPSHRFRPDLFPNQ